MYKRQTEQSDLYIDNGGEMNFLIEGDNLASLQLLEKTHKGKIDLIYIDPPYNTMSTGFTYSDALVDNGDNYRHSKWTSFMKHRLELARTLLSPTGCSLSLIHIYIGKQPFFIIIAQGGNGQSEHL